MLGNFWDGMLTKKAWKILLVKILTKKYLAIDPIPQLLYENVSIAIKIRNIFMFI